MPAAVNTPIRVLLVEDDPAFCAAFSAAVAGAEDAELAGIARSRSEGIAMVRATRADVLLVDLGLPDGSGIDVIRAMHREAPGCTAVVSSVFGDEQHVVQAIQAGAAGYLLKDTAPEDVVEELRCVHRGGSPISPIIARSVLRLLQQQETPEAPVAADSTLLSAREAQVLELVAKGFSYDEIASQIGVSRHTVLTFVRRIYAKLEVNSKMEAVNAARRKGLLPR
ncbi:response regulator [Variovorax sp. VNK109]|uniref:response regulator n=1 Tax=Variovorax sp. VNK109 TaxID=3400919 RepID=UPI003BFCDF42